MKAAPHVVRTALALEAPLRPQRSVARLATMLPTNPPTVKTEVTTEKVKSDMGMHVGTINLVVNSEWANSLHVRTALI